MSEEKKLICPFMSCRTTRMEVIKEEGEPDVPTYTPVVANCVKGDCAIYDQDNKVCSLLSLKMEIVRLGEVA